MKKYEFMYRLDKALGSIAESEKNDIMNDYEEHFRIGAENGKTDDEICDSLGNPEELAKSYLDGTEQNAQTNSGVSDGGTLPQQNTQTTAAKTDDSKVVGIVALVLLIIFVFIPVGGTVLGILAGLFFGAIGCGIGGIAAIGAAFYICGSTTSMLAVVLLGIALIAFGVLLGFATYYACKGVYKLVLMLIDFCKSLVK